MTYRAESRRSRRTVAVFLVLIYSVPLCGAGNDESTDKNKAFPPNTWVRANPGYGIPGKYKSGEWVLTDGYSDSLYRSRTGSVLLRTGVASKEHGINPGFYSNAMLEWNPEKGRAEVIDVFEGWGGGSSGGAKILPPFHEYPSPSPRHTYDGMAYDSNEDAIYLMLGANKRMQGGTGDGAATEEAKAQLKLDNRSLWKYTFIDSRWHRLGENVRQFWNENVVPPYESHLEYWPRERKLIFLSGKRHRYAEFDTTAQKWNKVELISGPGMDVYGARSMWDSSRELWVFRRGEKIGYINPKTKTGGRIPNLPAKYGILEKGQKPWMLYKNIAYISKRDVYIVTAQSGNDTFIYHPQEERWQQISGGDMQLPNGYMEYDEKTDTVVLVKHLDAYRFQYVPE